MIAKQEPFHTRAQDLAPTKALHPRSWTQWADAKLNDVSSDPVRFRRLQIVLGVVALAWVGCVGTLMLRPVASPETAAALPPLASAVPPLTEDASNSPSQTIESERLSGSEPAPFNSDLWQQASRENVAPPASTTTPAAPNVLPPPARKAARRDDAAPLPPPRPLEFGPGPRQVTTDGQPSTTSPRTPCICLTELVWKPIQASGTGWTTPVTWTNAIAERRRRTSMN